MPDKGRRPRPLDAAEGSITVSSPVVDVYQHALAFEKYSEFISAIKRVRRLDACRFLAHLVIKEKSHAIILEITLRVSGRRIAWRIIAEGDTPAHVAAGTVYFMPSSDLTTCVTFKLASSFGAAASPLIDRYLRQFKIFVEEKAAESKTTA
jgi:uncharacterized membrane protein